MSDADMENTETQVSLDFAERCNYISHEEYQNLLNASEEVGRMLNHMVENPEKYSPKQSEKNKLPTANCQLPIEHEH